MINRVVLLGRLTRDVDLKYTQSGTAVGSFSLAVQRPFKDANGERSSDFVNAIIWRNQLKTLLTSFIKDRWLALKVGYKHETTRTTKGNVSTSLRLWSITSAFWKRKVTVKIPNSHQLIHLQIATTAKWNLMTHNYRSKKVLP